MRLPTKRSIHLIANFQSINILSRHHWLRTKTKNATSQSSVHGTCCQSSTIVRVFKQQRFDRSLPMPSMQSIPTGIVRPPTASNQFQFNINSDLLSIVELRS